MTITNGYVTLASMKNYLGITDSIDDTLLEEIIESASRSIDRIANRFFYLNSTATARQYRTNDPYSLITDDIGSLTDLAITLDTAGNGTYSTAVTINTDYLMEPLNSASLGRPWTNVGLSELGAISMSPLGRDIAAMVRAYRREGVA